MSQALSLSSSATEKLGVLLSEENNPNLKLRIFVSGGGCSGFQYGFTFDDQQDENDEMVDYGPVKVLVDAVSIRYLRGAEIDFVEDLNGAQFVIKNPNAGSSCGCGNSFTPKEGGGCAMA
ncbi:MAG: iron-sulfur cluster insertion protein ErpA [Magnetococcales bacterium]|nr:iron-sulfur cluster insertion protein ErpA [Magnetococcales bacterium]